MFLNILNLTWFAAQTPHSITICPFANHFSFHDERILNCLNYIRWWSLQGSHLVRRFFRPFCALATTRLQYQIVFPCIPLRGLYPGRPCSQPFLINSSTLELRTYFTIPFLFNQVRLPIIPFFIIVFLVFCLDFIEWCLPIHVGIILVFNASYIRDVTCIPIFFFLPFIR